MPNIFISPTHGTTIYPCILSPGNTITLFGSSFGPTTARVYVGGKVCFVTQYSTSQISCALVILKFTTQFTSIFLSTLPLYLLYLSGKLAASLTILNQIVILQQNGELYSSTDKFISFEQCPPGTYQVGTDPVCTPCMPGTYTYNPTLSSTTCTSCTPGTYNTAAGASACIPCPVGFAFNSTTSCLPCPIGTSFQSILWVSFQTDIVATLLAGFHASSIGSFSCEPCLENFYNPVISQAVCVGCPDLSTSPPGSTVCACNSGSSACDFLLQFLLIDLIFYFS
jgi:hypothetical protein